MVVGRWWWGDSSGGQDMDQDICKCGMGRRGIIYRVEYYAVSTKVMVRLDHTPWGR